MSTTTDSLTDAFPAWESPHWPRYFCSRPRHQWRNTTCLTEKHLDCKVRAEYLDAGWADDSRRAKLLLKQGAVYTLKRIRVYDYVTDVELHELPNVRLNSAHFVLLEEADPETV